ncbi:MAG: helix-turn-helix transcriptional regulator [Peptococcaceae bacterium]|nr:helix-turn-helix transcriptional regulator [Peptococcaceae bacterium]MBQ2995017.1 helix-turn-helix transcriptional regulator [Peptococcaceae bacterium]
MIHAYDEKYLHDAMRNLGEAMDYAANVCHLDLDEFLELFIAEGFAAQFERGVPKYVCGMSGTELVCNVLIKTGIVIDLPDAQMEYDYSREYWCGWILAYYQWYTAQSFDNIKSYLSMRDIAVMYHPLHEAPEEKFVDVVSRMVQQQKPPTRLQTLRKLCGYSQKELSDRSGVSLRSIQQYEQRVKDINKAAGTTLLALAQTLHCSIESLLEFDFGKTENHE